MGYLIELFWGTVPESETVGGDYQSGKLSKEPMPTCWFYPGLDSRFRGMTLEGREAGATRGRKWL
jgi:hypothetical protein